jgi:hypothetical protein
VHGLIADSPGGAWSTGAAILTFVFPMLLFIAVAAALYVLYTKPEVVPGHQVPSRERPVSYTAVPGAPADAGAAARTEDDAPVATSADQPAATSADQTAVTSADQTAETSTDQTAETSADQTAVTSTDEAPATGDGA